MDRVYVEKCKEKCIRITDAGIRANQTYMVVRQIQQLCYDKNEVINLSTSFYHTVLRNCIQTLFIEVNKMFSCDKKAEGIRRLLLDIQKNIDKFDGKSFEAVPFEELTSKRARAVKYNSLADFVTFGLSEIERNEKIIKAVKTQRDQYYAHRDSDVRDLAAFFEQNKVTYEAFQKLLVLNMNLYNGLYSYFLDSTVAPLVIGYDDLQNTIDCAEKWMMSRKKNLLGED